MRKDSQNITWINALGSLTCAIIIIILLGIMISIPIKHVYDEYYNKMNQMANKCFQTLSETNMGEFELSDKVRFKLGTSPVNTKFYLEQDCGLDKKKILDALASHQVINYVLNKKTGKIEYKIMADTFEPKILQELIEPYQSYIQQPVK